MAKRMRFILSTIMVIVAMTAKAQVTTSSLSGKVTDPDKEAIIGATVQAIHEPSGTRYGAITNIDGRYTIQGMRAGGPYSVEVSYIGYQTMMYKDVTLQLGEVYNLNVQMKESSELLEEVVVTAQKTKFASEKTGATTNISNTQIASMPSVSRSITDYSRLSAYGGNGMSFAGSDGRTANFTIDGANFNNNFGLSSNLPGGGNPVSIEAIDEIQIVISPFDVRQTNFIGGGINAITKSGTNTYKGTAYIYHQNENMRGDAIDRETILGAREKDQSTTYGFTIGGPIIKNKLFFFANGELQNTPAIANRWRASEDGVANADAYISRATVADLQNVSDIAKERYGYDTGSFSSFPSDNKNTKLLARKPLLTRSWAVWTGTSTTTIAWPCVITIPRIPYGMPLTLPLWTVVLVCRVVVLHSMPCRMPTPCIPWITWYIHCLSTLTAASLLPCPTSFWQHSPSWMTYVVLIPVFSHLSIF